VNSETLSKAYRFVKQFRADGGTQMIPALEFALTDRQIDGPALRQVVFITDGAVGYEKAVFKRIENQLGRSRLFTVGIGQAPNRYFMQQAAEAKTTRHDQCKANLAGYTPRHSPGPITRLA